MSDRYEYTEEEEQEQLRNQARERIDGKYGVITTEKKLLHPGEPVFLLRAQDPLAPQAIEVYGEICREARCNNEHIEAVYRHAGRIRAWQRANPELVKEKPGAPKS